jgi:hypothetical protein
MPLNWLEEITEVSSVGMTVQAQALSLEEIDPASQLQHPVFFPVAPARSVKLSSIYETDYRPAADRREWNGSGREIPLPVPEVAEVEMTPIEAQNTIGEQELQALTEASLGENEQAFRRLVMASVPQRVDMLVNSVYRRAELDAMEAWAKGQITAKNPTNGTTFVASLGFDAGRLQTAGTAWNDPSLNAWEEFVAWLEDGEAEMGPIIAVKGRRNAIAEIIADSPNVLDYGGQGISAVRTQAEARMADQFGHAFRFIISEERVDVFNDGGSAVTRTAVWPAQYLAAVPASGTIGATWRAPVSRAAQLARQFPQAGVDVRNVTVYHIGLADDKNAQIQAQANWLSLPQERNVWTIDVGF